MYEMVDRKPNIHIHTQFNSTTSEFIDIFSIFNNLRLLLAYKHIEQIHLKCARVCVYVNSKSHNPDSYSYVYVLYKNANSHTHLPNDAQNSIAF